MDIYPHTIPTMDIYPTDNSHYGHLSDRQYPLWTFTRPTISTMDTFPTDNTHYGHLLDQQYPLWTFTRPTIITMDI